MLGLNMTGHFLCHILGLSLLEWTKKGSNRTPPQEMDRVTAILSHRLLIEACKKVSEHFIIPHLFSQCIGRLSNQ